MPTIVLGEAGVEHVDQPKLLEVIITDDLKWQGNTDYVCEKVSSCLYTSS